MGDRGVDGGSWVRDGGVLALGDALAVVTAGLPTLFGSYTTEF